MSPLAPLFAHLRSALYGSENHAVLDQIERHVQDMEKALAHSNRPGVYCEGGTVICEHCVGSCGVEEHDELVAATLAALPAREKGTE